MNYTNADFIRLMTEIEDQAGLHLEEICGGQEYQYTTRDGSVKTHFTAGCENETMFLIDYDPAETVVVPEPVLEPDPDRDGRSHRAVMEPDPDDPTGRGTRIKIQHVEYSGHIPAGGPDRARVCASHDDVGRWPRFRHVIKDTR